MAKRPSKRVKQPVDSPVKRPYLKQSEVPAASLDEALRVPQAIWITTQESRPLRFTSPRR
jgi:hypothetical protein